MKQIITIGKLSKYGGNFFFFSNNRKSVLGERIINFFNLESENTYSISINVSESGKYRFKKSHSYYYYNICISSILNEYIIGSVCRDLFNSLYFIPDETKRYTIKIKKYKNNSWGAFLIRIQKCFSKNIK
jgi:hypothetical protein